MAKAKKKTVKSSKKKTIINTLNEKPLHAALKKWYSRPGDRFEVELNGFHIDIVRGDLLIEVQTQNLFSIRRKLKRLLENHKVRVVLPIARDKWIVRLDKDKRTVLGRRKSPRHGTYEDLFLELVSIPTLIPHPNFSLEVLITREEELRVYDPKRAWRRRGWVIHEHRLVDVVDHRLFKTTDDIMSFLPPGLEVPFTTGDMAESMNQPRWLTQKVAYCLREMGTIQQVGKQGNAIVYSLL
jgi:hypothetical protein